MYEAQLQEQLTKALQQRDEAYEVLRDFIQEYRTEHELDPDVMDDIARRAEEMTGYSYDPEEDHRELVDCFSCLGTGRNGPAENLDECQNCHGRGKVQDFG